MTSQPVASEGASGFWQQLDQAPVLLKQWILGILPEAVAPLASILIRTTAVLAVFAGLFALLTWVERKGLGRIQNRPGPNRVGPFGLFQPIADGIKSLTKEDIVPWRSDAALHFLAPVLLMVPSLLVYSVLPVGRNMTAIDLSCGVLFFFAVGSCTEFVIFLAGWGSRNKFALIGATRAIAQMVSYELPLVLSAVPVIIVAGTLSTDAIVDAQGGGFWHWHVCTPWGLACFVTFIVCAMAESNRSPFDLPEAESELIAGHLTEYSGFKYALFFMAEYLGLIAISGMAATLFLGGWQAPVDFLGWVPSWAWFLGKVLAIVFFFIWVRGTLPRLRADQLMALCWKFLLPLMLVVIALAAFWGRVEPALAWSVSSVAILASAWGLSRLVASQGVRTGRRTYRYADQ